MSFVHDDPEFQDLLRIVAGERGLAAPLVEKDYWVTHALWALHETGLVISFKGGTSLSKGFRLIDRFSEDLDLQIEAEERLPALEGGLQGLVEALLDDRTIRKLPRSGDPAFLLEDSARRGELARAHAAIEPMFWGRRVSLEDATERIRAWLSRIESAS